MLYALLVAVVNYFNESRGFTSKFWKLLVWVFPFLGGLMALTWGFARGLFSFTDEYMSGLSTLKDNVVSSLEIDSILGQLDAPAVGTSTWYGYLSYLTNFSSGISIGLMVFDFVVALVVSVYLLEFAVRVFGSFFRLASTAVTSTVK